MLACKGDAAGPVPKEVERTGCTGVACTGADCTGADCEEEDGASRLPSLASLTSLLPFSQENMVVISSMRCHKVERRTGSIALAGRRRRGKMLIGVQGLLAFTAAIENAARQSKTATEMKADTRIQRENAGNEEECRPELQWQTQVFQVASLAGLQAIARHHLDQSASTPVLRQSSSALPFFQFSTSCWSG